MDGGAQSCFCTGQIMSYIYILPNSPSCGCSGAAILTSDLMEITTQLHLHCRIDDGLQDHLVSLTGFKWG